MNVSMPDCCASVLSVHSLASLFGKLDCRRSLHYFFGGFPFTGGDLALPMPGMVDATP
jgi:hypothetical protein